MLNVTEKAMEKLKEVREKGLAGTPNNKRAKQLVDRGFPYLYRHFKGGYYMAIELAYDCDTREPKVVYTSAQDGKSWIRPLESFTSYVDNVKYPSADQPYRLATTEELFKLGYTAEDLLADLISLEFTENGAESNLKLSIILDYKRYCLENKCKKEEQERE